MKAGIVSIGTELLLGEVVDTNASYIASQLPLLGLELQSVIAVPDRMDSLVEAFQQAWQRFDVVIATGGLGPTQDDLTREAIAQLLGEEMTVSPELESDVRAIFAAMGRDMSPSNIKQATLIPSAQAIPNPRGTAPGWWVEKNGKLMVAMPGPPAEMQRMWEVEVMPRLRARIPGDVVLLRTLKCFGLSEAEVGEKAGRVFGMGNPILGVYAKPDGIHLRLMAMASDQEKATALIAEAENRLRSTLTDHLWGTDSDTLENTVGQLLSTRHLTLATMESCTGGLLASTVTDVPGSSAYFKGGFVAYTNDMKASLGVDAGLIKEHGAVSREAAEAMAQAARRQLGADIGLAVTGVAGPDTLEGKPPGLVYIGIADGKSARSVEGRFPPRRVDVKRRAAVYALFVLREKLISSPS
ncbi:MAG: competence/damage-inducible protein A [Dehalococcoidia bacterium]|nr:competence/damage-inducible protein A [Dehalococcoidia bacterium]